MALHEFPMELLDVSEVKANLRRRLAAIEDGAIDRQVIAIINGKGGVGKSSLAAALAVAWAKLGRKVALVEMDEQGNNGEDLGTTGTPLADDGAAQHAAIIDGKPLIPAGPARPNLNVFPGGSLIEEIVEELYVQRRRASYLDDPEDQRAWMGLYAAAIDRLREDHDIIILDVAPGSEPLQLQALVASDYALIPSKSDPSSRKGLRTVARRYAVARQLNPQLRILGVVVFATNTAATKVQKQIKENLRADLGEVAPVFDGTIRHVESAAVACRTAGKVPQEMQRDKGLDPKLLPSVKSLAGDYQALAIEAMQAMAEINSEEESDA